MPYRSHSGPSRQYGAITDVQPGGLDTFLGAEQLLSRLPLTLDRQGYHELAHDGLDAATVLTLVKLLRASGRVTETDTPSGRRVSRR